MSAGLPVRCEFCGRVRHGLGQDWFIHSLEFIREVAGACRSCGDERHDEAERTYWREWRAAQRRKATGRCAPVEGDVFRGMRGEDE
jgi:hypothetical protein